MFQKPPTLFLFHEVLGTVYAYITNKNKVTPIYFVSIRQYYCVLMFDTALVEIIVACDYYFIA